MISSADITSYFSSLTANFAATKNSNALTARPANATNTMKNGDTATTSAPTNLFAKIANTTTNATNTKY